MTKEEAISQVHRGMTFGFYARNGVFASGWAREQVDRMAELGIQWICVVATVFQETATSTLQYRDFEETPDDGEVRRIIDYIHEKGMNVLLRPMLECQDGHGRTQVWFPGDGSRIPNKSSNAWERWFRSMRARTRHYARIAQETECEMYCLDSELDRTVSQNKHWLDVLETARSNYDGAISSCHTHMVNFERELEREDHWFYKLDVLQTSFYRRSTDKPGATVDEMVEFLKSDLELYRRIAKKFGKPVAFGECGCTSCTGAAMRPSSWSGGDKYAPEEQANHLEAVMRTFWKEPWWGGLYWWKWDEQNDRPQFKDDPAGDKGFVIDGKPAADVMQRWYAKADRE